ARYLGTRPFILKQPLRAFSLLEWAIAGWALLLLLLFPVLNTPIKALYAVLPDHPFFANTLRVLVPFLLLIPPTVFMGATLPCLATFLTGRSGSFAQRLSWLYGLNTLGAVFGVFASGFLLIPRFGVSGSTFIAMACNVAVALFALVLARRQAGETSAEPERETGEDAIGRSRAWGIFLIAGVSSLLALFMEIVWFRSLILIFGSTTYSFSAMLTIFLLGTALGPLIFSRFLGRVRHPARVMSVVIGLCGLFFLLTQHGFIQLPEQFLGAMRRSDFTWRAFIVQKFLLSAAIMLPATCLLSLNFILCAQWARDEGLRNAGSVGRVYLANTLGGVLGSLLAGFVFIPWVGLQKAYLIGGCFGMAVAGLLALIAAGDRRPFRIAIPVAAVAIMGLSLKSYTPWDYTEFSVGAYFKMKKDNPEAHRGPQRKSYPVLDRKVIYSKAGSTATAAVTRFSDGLYSFSMDGKIEADTSLHGLTNQRMVGHLAMLFHPAPRKALNIGLGAGMSLGALGTHD
ncbi:MAG: hypothetical protein AAF492_20720, partial [Verrucomicrobiota bacterium]